MAARDRRAVASEGERADRSRPRLAAVGSCPICDASDAETFFNAPDLLHGVPGEFTYRRCSSCRTVFQDPRVVAEDIPLCYPVSYHTHATSEMGGGSEDDEHIPARRFECLRARVREAIVDAVRQPRYDSCGFGAGRMLACVRGLRERTFFGLLDELIPRQAGAARALDVGCGTGRLMVALGRAGWNAEGLEPDPVAAEIARRTSGCRVVVGGFLTADLPSAAFDLVVLSHVFEHLADSQATLRRIAALLAAAGRAVLIYPNPAGLGARLFKKQWTEWDPPRHLVMPPLSAICSAAQRNGLRPVSGRSVTRSMRGLAWSRCVRAGLAPTDAQVDGRDKVLRNLSNLMVGFGLQIGEEIVVSFGRQASDSVIGG